MSFSPATLSSFSWGFRDVPNPDEIYNHSLACMKNLQGDMPKRHPNQTPKPPQQARFNTKTQQLYSRSLWVSKLLILSLRRSPDTLCGKLISRACIRGLTFQSLPGSHSHSWGLECKWSGKLFLSAQLSLHHNSSIQCPHYCWCHTNTPIC